MKKDKRSRLHVIAMRFLKQQVKSKHRRRSNLPIRTTILKLVLVCNHEQKGAFCIFKK